MLNFVLGVLTTVSVEAIILVIAAFISIHKEKKQNTDNKE